MMRRRGVGLVGVAVVAHHASNKGAQQQAAADQQAAAAAAPPQAAAPEPAAAPPPSGGLSEQAITELTQLSELQKSGVLTQEEFDAQKAKILAA